MKIAKKVESKQRGLEFKGRHQHGTAVLVEGKIYAPSHAGQHPFDFFNTEPEYDSPEAGVVALDPDIATQGVAGQSLVLKKFAPLLRCSVTAVVL